MVQLAVYPYSSSVHVGVKTEQSVKTIAFDQKLSLGHLRLQMENWLDSLKINQSELEAVFTTGGLLQNQKSGLYALSSDFLKVHKVNLGPQLGSLLAQNWQVPIYIVDPLSALEYHPFAKVTGTPVINRGCLCDSFIFKHLAHQEETKLGLGRKQGKFLVAYLDEEIQIGVINKGEFLDGGSSHDEGPFAWEQAGGLPFDGLLDLCLEMEDLESTFRKINQQSGIKGYLGYLSLADFIAHSGAEEIVLALAYQIAKELSSYATVLQGQINSLIFCGELTKHKVLMENVLRRIRFLGRYSIYEGNQGINALLAASQRLQEGEEILNLCKGEG